MLNIRPYASSDLASLTELMTDLGTPSTLEDMQKRMERMEASPNYCTFVATMNDAVVGMIGIRMQFSYVSSDLKTQISALVTKEEFQGRGIGKALIKHVEEWMEARGSHFVYLTSGIKESRSAAHEFYKKAGFEITGYRFAKRSGK